MLVLHALNRLAALEDRHALAPDIQLGALPFDLHVKLSIHDQSLCSLDRRIPFEVDTLDRLITFYVHIPRFDYTALDPNLTDEFRRQANRLPEITAEALAEVIDRTLTAGLLNVLNLSLIHI